jgi:hypothetical protein
MDIKKAASADRPHNQQEQFTTDPTGQSGTFPQPVKLGARAIGWILSDVENWIASKARREK